MATGAARIPHIALIADSVIFIFTEMPSLFSD